MKNFENEKTTVEVQPDQEKTSQHQIADTQNEKEMTLGKFANAQALLLAYQNLEREFTKKSQQLKQIQKKLSCDNDEVLCDEKPTSPQTDDMDNSALQNPDLSQKHVDNPVKTNEVFADQLAQDKDFLEKYIFANPDVTNQILQRYLLSLSQNDLPATIIPLVFLSRRLLIPGRNPFICSVVREPLFNRYAIICSTRVISSGLAFCDNIPAGLLIIRTLSSS